MINIIVLDIDGTLLRSNGKVSQRTVEALKGCMDLGKKIVIATARPPMSISELLPSEIHDSVWICYNGAEIYEGGEKIYEKYIHSSNSKQIVEWINMNSPSCKVGIESENELFANQTLWEGWTCRVVDLTSVTQRNIAKILVDLEHFEDRDIFLNSLPDGCRITTTDKGCLGHIMENSVSKAEALRFMLSRWGLTMDNVIAFGDDVNDVEIISASGIGVAMGNGVLEVKEVAKLITKSNDEDGIAVVLEDMFL